MWPFSRIRREVMPARFQELASYNTDRNRGVVFDDATVARMAALQVDFNAWSRNEFARHDRSQ
jgi:hypothetical protein